MGKTNLRTSVQNKKPSRSGTWLGSPLLVIVFVLAILAMEEGVGGFSQPVWASEKLIEQLGVIKIENLVLRPQMQQSEPSKGRLSLGESLLSVRWDMDDSISAVIAMGPKSLTGPMTHFYAQTQVSEDLGFIEAYGEYNSNYGRWRAGMQPLNFGLEGSFREAELDLQRSLIFQKRWVPLRDVGVSYAIENNGYFTQMLVHNGVGLEDPQGCLWYTAQWGWAQPGRWKLGFAGETGCTKSETTSQSQDTVAGVNPLQGAHWRIGGPFLLWTPRNWKLSLESYFGNLVQNNQTHGFSTGHLDVSYTQRNWLIGLRYDQMDPRHSHDLDLVSQVSLAVGFFSERKTSRLYLVATKTIEEGPQIHNDELRLIWHLTPEISNGVN